jgi:hypothetical protein
MNKLATLFAVVPINFVSSMCFLDAAAKEFEFNGNDTLIAVLSIIVAVVIGYFAMKSAVQRRWVYGSLLVLILTYSEHEIVYSAFARQKMIQNK